MKREMLVLICFLLSTMNGQLKAENIQQTIIINPIYITMTTTNTSAHPVEQTHEAGISTPVKKTVLPNGLTVLVVEDHTLPKVAIQLWYGVGSRDEEDKERGLAHLIEHMIFKGTKKLSESDINVITHQLSGNCNAFTSYDYTGYLFNFPTQNWQEALSIMADCMVNCTFDPQMLNSEMKAVIQELKLYRDRYMSSLCEGMISMIFSDHPYHHPVIGYKQDLWSVTSQTLHEFYRKHYLPNNATLVVVGDVKTEEVFGLAQQHFGLIPADHTYKRSRAYLNKSLASKSITLYRDVKQPILAYAFVVPGTKDKKDYALESLAWIVGKGKSSRLHTTLVEQEQLAVSVHACYYDLFDYGLFLIDCEPKRIEDAALIEHHITQIIRDIASGEFTDQELSKAIKLTQMTFYETLEDIQEQATQIGKYFVATGDEHYAFTFTHQSKESLRNDIITLSAQYLRSSLMHKGSILPLAKEDIALWQSLQEESDQEDTNILQARPRTLPVEPARYALTVHPQPSRPFNFPKAAVQTLSNGLKTFSYRHATTPTVEIVLDLKIDETYDPETKLGLVFFMSKMLAEGTKEYNAAEFAKALESRGISLNIGVGSISMNMLVDDLEFGLDMLNQMVTAAVFDAKQIEKVRELCLSNLKHFWDDASSVGVHLAKKEIYKKHPYARNVLGTSESIASITKNDLELFYKKYVSPRGSRLAVVGDVDQAKIARLIENKLSSWKGQAIEEITFPPMETIKASCVDSYLNRDQVALIFAQPSVKFLDADYDKLLLFDQILSGGALGSMSSRLFDLREQSGLFYTIKGSTIFCSHEQPGIVMVKTIVSLDRLAEAEKAILDTLATAADSVTPEELDEAKRALESALIANFSNNNSIANAFLFLDRYALPSDYFDNRAAQLEKITVDQMRASVHKILKPNDLVIVRVGRTGLVPHEASNIKN